MPLPLEYEWRLALTRRWHHGPLVVRVWRGRTRADHAEEYLGYLVETGVKDCRSTPGNRGVRLFRRVRDGCAEFLFISWWDSLEAVQRFAGPRYDEARYYPRDERFLLELEPEVLHYEEVVVRP